jgi:hypothetical protein
VTPERVDVIGVPMDLGADRRGVDMGPSAIRYAGLHAALERLGITAVDRGNIPVRVAESASIEEASAKYLPIITEACAALADVVTDVIGAGGFPLVLGGDHSIAIGTLAGVARTRGRRASSGSTRTATSTHRSPRRAATCTACPCTSHSKRATSHPSAWCSSACATWTTARSARFASSACARSRCRTSIASAWRA